MRIDIWAWPGTALTSETVLLIDLKPVADAAGEPTLAKCEFQTFRDRSDTRGYTIRLAQFCCANLFRRLRARDRIVILLHFLFSNRALQNQMTQPLWKSAIPADLAGKPPAHRSSFGTPDTSLSANAPVSVNLGQPRSR